MDDSKTQENTDQQHESLGQFLRNTRVARAIELTQISEETRISGSNLRAMEADDFGALPADAFARGFYALYAKALQLNSEEIVARFLQERGSRPAHQKQGASPVTPLPGRMARQVSSMAEPANSSPMSSIGFILLLLIILAGGVCLYFSINPATYLSEKLRQLQQIETKSPTADETLSPQQETTNSPASGSVPE